MMSLPNILSLSRVAISPFFLIMFLSKNAFFVQISCYLFLIGALTDYIDGWIARKLSMESSWGGFFDPLADKVLTTSALIGFSILDIIPWSIFFVFLVRDIATTLMRVIADRNNNLIVTSKTAKWKTFLQMLLISVILILIYIKSLNINSEISILADNLIHSEMIKLFTYGLALFTVWTLFEYIFKNNHLFLGFFFKKNEKN